MKIRNLLLYIVIVFVSFGCKEKDKDNEEVEELDKESLEYHLSTSLIHLDNSLGIEQKLTEDVYLRSFAFYEKSENNYSLILELQDELDYDIASKYTFAVEGFVAEEEKEVLSDYAKFKNRLYEGWFSNNGFVEVNNHSYVVIDVKTKIKNFKLIKFYVYDSKGYNGDRGERIVLHDYTIEK